MIKKIDTAFNNAVASVEELVKLLEDYRSETSSSDDLQSIKYSLESLDMSLADIRIAKKYASDSLVNRLKG